ncbi:hypothetical protein GCM10009780_43330 [Actinomadura alba]
MPAVAGERGAVEVVHPRLSFIRGVQMVTRPIQQLGHLVVSVVDERGGAGRLRGALGGIQLHTYETPATCVRASQPGFSLIILGAPGRFEPSAHG